MHQADVKKQTFFFFPAHIIASVSFFADEPAMIIQQHSFLVIGNWRAEKRAFVFNADHLRDLAIVILLLMAISISSCSK